MENYYESIIAEIRECIEKGEYEQAQYLLKKEMSMPYIPEDIEKQFREIQKDIRYGLSEKKERTESSLDTLLDGLRGDAMAQLTSVNALAQRNLRDIIPEIQEYLAGDPFPEAACFLIDAIGRQELEDEFTYNHDGMEYTFWGDSVTPAAQSKGYQEALSYLYEWLGLKYPSVYEMAKKLLAHEVYMFLPLSYGEGEGKYLALQVGEQICDMLGEEELKQQIQILAGRPAYTEA
ncbi:MAG: DUF3196 domain-containing protein [Bulleidia sp.]